MNLSEVDLERELMEECGFWKNYTGYVRPAANSTPMRSYWVVRTIARALFLCLRFASPKRRSGAASQAHCDVLAVYLTENQRRALDGWFASGAGLQTASWMQGADWKVSWFRCGLLTLKYLASTYRVLRARTDCALTIPWVEDFVRYRVGLALAHELYRRVQPRIVLVSNDHSGEARAFVHVARQLGLRTIYTQHASIGLNFPKLDFDLALLDGIQAYLQYRNSGSPAGNVVITGRNRPLGAASRKCQTGELRVGIATNPDDSLLDWMPLLRVVGRRFPGAVLRCHPAESRRLLWRLLCRRHGIFMDHGELHQFMGDLTVLICGRSGIILDAALCGVPCLVKTPRVQPEYGIDDYYGYERLGLCKRIKSIDELTDLVLDCASGATNPDAAAAFEAGFVQDPMEEKRVALEVLLGSVIRSESVVDALTRRYKPIVHGGVPIYMSSEYANLVAERNWLELNHPSESSRADCPTTSVARLALGGS